MRRPGLIAIGMLMAIAAFAQDAEPIQLEYVYEEGEQYRVLSTVEQDVWINGIYSHYATILNRISISVPRVEDGRGYHVARFVTSEEVLGGVSVYEGFTWGEEYESEFWRDRLGYYEIAPRYYMPVVRDVPVFP